MPNLSLGQGNLVHNPSFEDTISCPIFWNENLCDGWSSYRLSPDYYNECANGISCCSGVPNNWLGYQQPFEGSAYTGLLTFGIGGSTNNIREFMGSKLTEPLVPGIKYYTSIYISSTTDGNQNICFTNNMGIKFSTQEYSYNNPAPVDNRAHVNMDQVLSDTASWVKLQGSFIADSAYEYIILGNFFDDTNTVIAGCNTTIGAVGAYYYIDNLCVSTDSLNCNVTTGLPSSNNKPVITIFPNPASDFIAIDFSYLQESYSLSIYDAFGKLVQERENVSEQRAIINLDQIKSGLLLISISHNDQVFRFKHLKR